jgi:transposase
MNRQFTNPNYEATLNETIRLGDALPAGHLARFVVGIVSQLDVSSIYAKYGERGGKPLAPEVLLGLLFYGYATGIFSSRKIERAIQESIPFRYVAGGLHPDHDTIANFRKNFLPEIQELFVQVLLLAQAAGVLKMGNLSIDGSKIHADASKSHAVSHKRLLELEEELREQVAQLFDLAERADQGEVNLPENLIIQDEIALRQTRLENLSKAKKVLQERARQRYANELAEYEAKMRKREEKAQKTKRKPGGREPKAPTPGPRDQDQYNFTDPDSRIMKNSTDEGFDQHYNVQAAVTQETMLIVATSLSNHPNDKQGVKPTVNALSPQLGHPKAAALDTGFFSEANIRFLEERNIDPYIAIGRDSHQWDVASLLAGVPTPPPTDASPTEKMAYKLRTEVGHAIYALRKSTVEPVIGIIKEVLGFRQFSLRGLLPAAGEWSLVCLAFNLKRLHLLMPQ